MLDYSEGIDKAGAVNNYIGIMWYDLLRPGAVGICIGGKLVS